MAYKIILALLILGVVLSGCVSDKTVYYSQKLNESITLYKDNTFYIKGSDGTGYSGTYRIDNDRLILALPPFGATIEGKIQGDKLIDKEGDEYIKE